MPDPKDILDLQNHPDIKPEMIPLLYPELAGTQPPDSTAVLQAQLARKIPMGIRPDNPVNPDAENPPYRDVESLFGAVIEVGPRRPLVTDPFPDTSPPPGRPTSLVVDPFPPGATVPTGPDQLVTQPFPESSPPPHPSEPLVLDPFPTGTAPLKGLQPLVAQQPFPQARCGSTEVSR